MNIEYKFRGQTCKEYPCDKKQGEWVYGGIVHQTDYYGEKCDKYFIIDGTTSEDNDIGFSYQVQNETVGQYIGYKDVLSREIYTGDILLYWNFNTDIDITEFIGTVEYNEKNYEFTYSMKIGDCFRLWIPQKYLIIGNKYDNPELLKESGKTILEWIKKILNGYTQELMKNDFSKEMEIYKKKWSYKGKGENI